jgi:SAM-dependent methyltransferase
MVDPTSDEPYHLDARGLFVPPGPVIHREDEYNPEGFATLKVMQERHFWYRGRHRFLLYALTASCKRYLPGQNELSGVDLGGGCGGWVRYLLDRAGSAFAELALADSSATALKLAGPVVGPTVRRYQIDLLDLVWQRRWDVAFLLDVLEHIPDDIAVLRQVRDALRPGGLLLVACPALHWFWSFNDVLAQHCRRYSRGDFGRLAAAAGLQLCRSRYFNFFLSPLLFLSRVTGPDPTRLSPDQARQLLDRTHRVPSAPVNAALGLVFAAEAPLGWFQPFPWGTSVLGVFRRP